MKQTIVCGSTCLFWDDCTYMCPLPLLIYTHAYKQPDTGMFDVYSLAVLTPSVLPLPPCSVAVVCLASPRVLQCYQLFALRK